jgi:hypothetical protein
MQAWFAAEGHVGVVENHRVAVDRRLPAGQQAVPDGAAQPVGDHSPVPPQLGELTVQEVAVVVAPHVPAVTVADDPEAGPLVEVTDRACPVLVPVQARGDRAGLGRLHLVDEPLVVAVDLLPLPAVERVEDGALAGAVRGRRHREQVGERRTDHHDVAPAL